MPFDHTAVFDVKLDSEQMVRTLMMLGMGDVDMLQGHDLVPPSLSTEDVEAWLARP